MYKKGQFIANFRFLPIALLFIINISNNFAQTIDQQISLYSIPTMSCTYLRYPSRESSQELDGIFYNPAGLSSLEDGFHFSFTNQIQKISNKINVEYKNLENGSGNYGSTLKNYIYPSIFAAYKHKKFTYYFDFLVLAGGGGLGYDNLPSADLPLSDMKDILNNVLLKIIDNNHNFSPKYGEIDAYGFDFSSKGFAYTPSFQLGATYKINDYISVALGGRYVLNLVNAKGNFSDISINVPNHGGKVNPKDYLQYILDKEDQTLTNIEKRLLGVSIELFDGLLVDRNIDITQSGYGLTPIGGLNFNWKNRYYASLKYEHRTKITLKTKVNGEGNDGNGIYEDGKELRADLPGFVTLGFRLVPNEKFNFSTGTRFFFNKRAINNGREKQIKKNYREFNMAYEYRPIKKLKVSAGYTFNNQDVNDRYQNEVNYYISSHTLAFGAAYAINPKIELEMGILNTFYPKKTFQKEYEYLGGYLPIETDLLKSKVNYNVKSTAFIFGVGGNFKFSKKNKE